MARNKYPEETVKLILDVSMKLFVEKGYDNTSIQDIIDNLGGLSKGAIYHHFKSKESILVAAFNKIDGEISGELERIKKDKDLNGLQKLRKMFAISLENPENIDFFSASPNLLENPKLLAVFLSHVIEHTVPYIIQPVVEEGARDGSINTKYPKELSQVMVLISNTWLNPLVYPVKTEDILGMIGFLKNMMSSMGIDLIDEQVEKRLRNMQNVCVKNKLP